MEQIKWSEELSVDNEVIDAQHRKLIRLLNKLIEEHNNELNKGAAEAILTELIGYAKAHLELEEAFLEKHDYPNLTEHKEGHKAFSYKMGMFSLEFLKGKEEVGDAMINYLRTWIIQHIMNDDQEYKYLMEEN